MEKRIYFYQTQQVTTKPIECQFSGLIFIRRPAPMPESL